jgi:hypothetical protein
METVRKGNRRVPRRKTAQAAVRQRAGAARLSEAAASPDAEDIALARLQAHLRRAETIQSSPRVPAPTVRRTTVRLPDELVVRLRKRAQREGTTPSQIVQQALEGFLRSR